MDKESLLAFEASLARCTARPDFLDVFYDTFLRSSPKVKEKFARTDFVKQKRALRESLDLMVRAAWEEGAGPPLYLMELARSHGRQRLAIGAELYDLWLDSLIAAARACDPEFSDALAKTWENVMAVGIGFLCAHYNAE